MILVLDEVELLLDSLAGLGDAQFEGSSTRPLQHSGIINYQLLGN